MSMLSVNDAAAIVGRHRSTIARAFLSGRLKGIRYPNGSYEIDSEDLLHVYGEAPEEGNHRLNLTEPEVTPSPTTDDLMDDLETQSCHYSEEPYVTTTTDYDETEDWYRVLYWTDTHVAPGDNFERLRWIANFVNLTKPDHVWHGGDMATFDSCSTYDPIGGSKHKKRPSIKEDLECLEQALAVYHHTLDSTDIPHSFNEGNHEYRLKKYEDKDAMLDKVLYPQLKNTFTQYGWDYYPYGEMVFLEGVGFTHVPFARTGKPYGSAAIMLRDMTHDLVYGHTHAFNKLTQPKMGQQNKVTLLNGGCTLPYNHVEEYAKLNPTGWEYGVIEISLYKGQIKDTSFTSLPTLQRIYNANRKTH